MSLLTHVLQPPAYGYEANRKLIIPTYRQLFREFFVRQNILKTRKNWLALFGWTSSCLFVIPLIIFSTNYFSWTLFFYGFIYSMVILGTHGTVWYHRYSTHRAYTFSHPFWRFLVKNLVKWRTEYFLMEPRVFCLVAIETPTFLFYKIYNWGMR